jgi:hypothetical protein
VRLLGWRLPGDFSNAFDRIPQRPGHDLQPAHRC